MNKTRIKSNIKTIKPRPIIIEGWQKSSSAGLGKLQRDIKAGYGWVKEKREKRISAGETCSSIRPKGIFPYKEFDDGIYKFDSWHKKLDEAKELCNDLESMGIRCRIVRKKAKFVVYTKGILVETV